MSGRNITSEPADDDPQAIGFHGTSVSELEQAFHHTVDTYLEDEASEQLKRLRIDLSLSLCAKYKLRTAVKNDKMNDVICRLVADYAAQKKATKPAG